MFQGMKYLGKATLFKMPQKIDGTAKRGIWQYDIG